MTTTSQPAPQQWSQGAPVPPPPHGSGPPRGPISPTWAGQQPPRRRMWPWVTLAAATAAVVSSFVTAVVLALLWPTVTDSPDPMQVAAFTQNAGTDLYGRGIWTDDGLLQVGLTVCETNGSMTEAQQVDQLKARWGGLDDYDVVTLMHHANARLCPSS